MKYFLYIVCLLVIASGGMSIAATNTEATTETMYATVSMPETTTTTVTTTTTKAPQKFKVIATAYCSCEKCCGKWALNRPDGIVYTASGAEAKANRTIAVDTSVFPFGTVLIDTYSGIEYVAEDTGSAIKGNKIDIYFDNHEDAWNFGKREIEVILKEG